MRTLNFDHPFSKTSFDRLFVPTDESQREATDNYPSRNILRTRRSADEPFDLDALLHPGNAFTHPRDVVNDADLTLAEKRAILASWASDACAVEAAPALRQPAGRGLVGFDEIIGTLRELDRQAGKVRVPHYRRVLAERRPGIFGRKTRRTVGQGSSLQ